MQSITPYEYLLIDVASQFGHDKCTWEERIDWTKENMPYLEDGIGLAKKSLLYAKAVNALRMVQRGESTNHIIGLDASASGISVMGLLIGCEKTLKQTNLIYIDKIQDVYTNLNEEMNRHLDVEIQVIRDKSKEALMTSIYGSRQKPKDIFGDETPELTQFYAAKQELIPGTNEVAKDILSAWNPHIGSYQWERSDGHTAKCLTRKAKNTSLRIRDIHGTRSSFTYKYMERGKPSTYSTPIVANIIQGEDGSIAAQMIRRCWKDGFNILTIHDEFKCHPNHVHQMRYNYRNICADLYKSNHLSNILSDLLGRSVKYTQWNKDLEHEIRNSEYAIS